MSHRDLSDIEAHIRRECRERGLCDLEQGSPEWERRAHELCEYLGNVLDEDDRERMVNEHLSSLLYRTVQETQQETAFDERIFVCEGTDEPAFTAGRDLTPSHKVLLGQNTDGAPAWLQLSGTLIRWPGRSEPGHTTTP